MTVYRPAPDGTLLAVHRWEPARAPRSTVVLVHGLAEHLGRYEHVAAGLTARGHLVTGADLRGFGRSAGTRAYAATWDVLLDDLAATIATARGEGNPVVLLGHSFGGLVAASYVVAGRPGPDLLVLSAPAIDDALPKVKKRAAVVLGTVSPRLSLSNGLRRDQLSRDPTVGDRYFADPLVHTRTTLRLGREAIRAQGRVRAALERITLPTLVIHAAEDTIVPEWVSRPLEDLPGVTRLVFPAFRHESFNEDGGREAIQAVADWIEARL